MLLSVVVVSHLLSSALWAERTIITETLDEI
jgi:hypothetical protein